jgi:hypothetical protein
MQKLTAYISHSIQGRYGTNATDKQMDANNRRAIKITKKLRKEFGDKIDFYLPAEHEGFVHRAFRMGLLSIDEILVIDCDIIQEKNILILYIPDSFISGGMIKEAHKARCLGKPILQINDRNWKQVIGDYLKNVSK